MNINLTISWEAVAVLLSAIAGICTLLTLFVRSTIDQAISSFEIRFFEKLNGKYISRDLWKEVIEDYDRRIDEINFKLNNL